ncbi:MAG: hypothetical protein JW776_04045 [Candidatus Lokiarchaeota archaeon]|nr:hypothetical protein [Candidatus Lokiarchaeota archaeon]
MEKGTIEEDLSFESNGLDKYYKLHDSIMKLMYLRDQIPFQKGIPLLITKFKLVFAFLKVRKYKDRSTKQLMD